MAETNVPPDSYATTIRPSVSHKVRQAVDLVGIDSSGLSNEAEYAAHACPTYLLANLRCFAASARKWVISKSRHRFSPFMQ
jgi:hypothetical protein